MTNKVWIALTLVFAGSTLALLYSELNRSISYSNCFDDLQASKQRERLALELLRPLSSHITKSELEQATKRASVTDSAFDKGERERVVADIEFAFDEAGRVRAIRLE